MGATENVSYTLNTVDRHAVAYSAVYALDCLNAKVIQEKSGTLCAKPNGGYSLNFQNPIAYTMKIRSGCEGGGKGALVQTEKSATLSTLQDQTVFQAVPVLNDQGGSVMDVSYDVTGALRAQEHGHQPIVFDARENGVSKTLDCSDANPTKNQGGLAIVQPMPIQDKTGTLSPGAHAGSYNGQDAYNDMLVRCRVFDARGNGNGKIVPTITGDHESRITDYTAIMMHQNASGEVRTSEIVHTLSTNANASGRNTPILAEKTIRWIVRRLTPVECERLQGYPDGWTDIGEWVDTKGKKHKPADSPRYKALGNSIALPQWFWIAQKMKPYLEPGAKLGSLFDGIGGFPLVWETTYGKGTARWASEIEEFPIAVTKKWFPEKESGA